MQDIHWRTDSTESSTTEACAVRMCDIPLNESIVLSYEEASIQKTNEKLEQEIYLVFQLTI